MELSVLAPDARLLLAAAVADGLVGDPVYPLHPIRLLGALLQQVERALRAVGMEGRIGGCVLFAALAALAVGGTSLAAGALEALHPHLGWAFHLFVLYSAIALRDLLEHALAIERAARRGQLPAARRAAAMLVGRDTAPMDERACRRAAIESLAENAVDGYLSPIFWYALLGLPGLVLFKVISTMDSMVGNKSPRYRRFGWCGARLDDLFNWLPARLGYLLLAAAALLVPGASALGALRVGWKQHALVPGPNSGWSEAAMAGALQRRLVGPLWREGVLVTETWLGAPEHPEGGRREDLWRACALVVAASSAFVGAAALYLC